MTTTATNYSFIKTVLLLFVLFNIGIATSNAQHIEVKSIRKLSLEEKAKYPILGNEKQENKKRERNSTTVKTKTKQILLSNNEKDTLLSPLDNCFYIWASLSPNGKNILFTAAGKGTYISDLKGNILHELGLLNAPSWINDMWITGMADQDNGSTFTKSEVIAIHIPTKKRYVLTKDIDIIAQYPKASATNDRIVFNTPDGDVYIIDVLIE